MWCDRNSIQLSD